jgi:hypothetical protein
MIRIRAATRQMVRTGQAHTGSVLQIYGAANFHFYWYIIAQFIIINSEPPPTNSLLRVVPLLN